MGILLIFLWGLGWQLGLAEGKEGYEGNEGHEGNESNEGDEGKEGHEGKEGRRRAAADEGHESYESNEGDESNEKEIVIGPGWELCSSATPATPRHISEFSAFSHG